MGYKKICRRCYDLIGVSLVRLHGVGNSLNLYLWWHSPRAGWSGITYGITIDDASWAVGTTSVPSSGVTPFIGFAAQAKLARFESARASALHTLRLDVYPGDATGTQGIGVNQQRCAHYIAICKSAGAQPRLTKLVLVVAMNIVLMFPFPTSRNCNSKIFTL